MSASSDLENRVGRLLAGDPQELSRPFETWNELRETAPVLRVNGRVVLSRYDDVRELLGDNNVLYTRAETRYTQLFERGRASFSEEGRRAFDDVLDKEFSQIVRMDPPDHPRVRKVVTPPFTARSLSREMQGAVDARVAEMLASLDGDADVVDFKKVAYTLPLKVLGDLLGIPLSDLDGVHEWAVKIAENKNNADSETAAIEAYQAYARLIEYIERLVDARRQDENATGLVAALIESVDNGTIGNSEMTSMLALMIFAGHETTSNLLAIGLLDLMNNRDQWEQLCADPSLTEAAVEELLRFVSPAHFAQVTARQPRELHGVGIDPGEVVVGVMASANRDPRVFADPDRLDIRRTDSRQHVSLGMGPHFCLGAGLARMEGVAMFRSLILRYPDMRLVEQPTEWGGRALRTPMRMSVSLGPAARRTVGGQS